MLEPRATSGSLALEVSPTDELAAERQAAEEAISQTILAPRVLNLASKPPLRLPWAYFLESIHLEVVKVKGPF